MATTKIIGKVLEEKKILFSGGYFNFTSQTPIRKPGTTAERIAYGNTLTAADVGILWSLDTEHKRPYTWDGGNWV